MKQIRQSVFETNSSSTHSISIHGIGDIEMIKPNEKGQIVIGLNVFGWDGGHQFDFDSKASYLVTAMWESAIKEKAMGNALLEGIISKSFYNEILNGSYSNDGAYHNDWKFDYQKFFIDGCDAENNTKMLNEYIANINPNYKKLIDVIKEQTGASDVLIQPRCSGCIDHQSRGTDSEAYEDLRNYLFNKESFVDIDNDNH